jgi:hypothetical protein
LKLNETVRTRQSARRLVADTTFNGGDRDHFMAVKVPRQCPLVLHVKVGCREEKAFGSGEVELREEAVVGS